ncbi:hypothetical protein FACS189426_24230 [Bacteroidia bacterium]|nr:hypothetical protein FACS189426_24230 [Bacteroidia bacterium]
MNIELLKQKFRELLQMEDSDDGVFEFKELLLESDEQSFLDFHFSILTEIKDEYLYRDILYFFADRKDKKVVEKFLYMKYKESNLTIRLKADIIQLLGTLKSSYGKEIALDNIQSNTYDLRYRSIIVLGWTGTGNDLAVLNERMLNDTEGKLREYAATAMRQIWYNHPKAKDKIAGYIYNAAPQEQNDDALTGMVITIQDLYRKKFGIKESTYGDISGNVSDAKEKMMTFLNKQIKT